MSNHDELKRHDITPTMDTERAFQLGYATALSNLITDVNYRPDNRVSKLGEATGDGAGSAKNSRAT